MTHNLTHISTKEQDSDSHSRYSRQMNIIKFLGLGGKKLAFLLVLSFYIVLPISVAHAGIFSFLGSFFDSGVTYEKKYVNSQTATVLKAAVNPDPNPSKGGGDITIVGGSALLPESGPSGTIADVIGGLPVSKHQISVYVVREGDSLSQIAKMFKVSVNTIIWANDINKKGIIKAGQTLVILPVSGIEYIIKKNDTLNGVAKKYKITPKEIAELNDIPDSSNLRVGDTLIIPGGRKAVVRYSSRRTKTIVRGTNVPAYVGYYIRPIRGGYNSRATAKNPHGLHGYNAVDLAVSAGTPIVAAASGRVVIARNSGWNGGYGRYVVIKHPNGTQTVYGHSSKVIVKRGQKVVQGQVIAYIGSTGNSTGPHVHFEIRGAKNPF